MGKKADLTAAHDILCEYDHPVLATVCTLAEASYLWHISPAGLRDAIYRHKLDARKSFTGGDWLITVSSLEKRYGAAKENTLWELQK